MAVGRLVIVCGAGLSMAEPSSLPSARQVGTACFDKHLMVDPDCDPALRDDLEAFAEKFVESGTLASVFINGLVPWALFVRPPNPGHAAVADFLVTGCVASAISANYDDLVERKARDLGADMVPALDGDEANRKAQGLSPLLKFHGCSMRDRDSTVWAPSQLTDDPVIRARIAKTKVWMAANLRNKDLLVVGFWSDWSYLNFVLAEAMTDVAPLSITVVDPTDEAALQAKAPLLWDLAHADLVQFFHVPLSGADVLDDLRRSFSKTMIRQVLAAGRAPFEAEKGAPCDAALLRAPDFEAEDLYALRRDIEGVPSTSPATLRNADGREVLGLMHLLLRGAGAVTTAYGYELNGRKVRVLDGSGRLLSSVRETFKEPPLQDVDVVVCAGALDLGLPGNVVRGISTPNVVRPGSSALWVDSVAARVELAV